MSEPGPSASSSTSRGRSRGKSRGGLGKYLRARGRGRGYGRPAEFHQRLVLESETTVEEDDEERAEREHKFSKRHLGTNADRYAESDPELDSDGEPMVEPEVDLSSFLERQRLSDKPGSALQTTLPDDDVDHSLAHISSHGTGSEVPSRKGKVEQIAWGDELDELSREKAVADANRDLKSRFRAKSERLRKKPVAPTARERKHEASYVNAPALPLPEGVTPKDAKTDMEDFLDDLLG
ncbi:hypothetical protein DFS33DRAFT_165610 [Desarmillaria ectypa]|nr:hypothetical protein DFS33DRAFT_165610 [Desarmillaria ectypa]